MFDDLYRNAKKVNDAKKEPEPVKEEKTTEYRRTCIQVDPSMKHLVTRTRDPVLSRLGKGSVVILDGKKIKF